MILPVDGPQLFFSSRFDVSVGPLLDALASLPEAAEIWAHCSRLAIAGSLAGAAI